MGFWKHLMSVDESRVSICIYVFIVSTVYALIEVYLRGDIPPNLLAFLGYLLAAIFGINVVNSIGTSYTNRNTYNQYPIQNNAPAQNQTNTTQNTSKPTI
jgi:hypothetical protein